MKIKYTRSELLFLTAYVIWTTIALLKYTYIKELLPIPINEVIVYVKYIVYVLLAAKFWNDQRYRFHNFIGLAIVFFIGYIEYSVQDNTVSLFILCIFIYSASNVEFENILRAALFVQVIVLISAIGLAIKGVIPNNIWDESVRQRYDLGFVYCTFSSHLMLFITMVYSCIRKKITFFETVILLLINLWLYSYNNTRLDLCIVVPFLMFFYIWTHFSREVKGNFINKLLFQYGGPIIAIFSILAQALYNSSQPLYIKFNELLSNRLSLGYNAIQEYGFTLFGQYIRWIGQGGIKRNPYLTYNYVDCSFLKYTLNYGVIFIILLLVGLVFVGKKAINRNEQAFCVSLLFLYIFAMVDAELCVLAFHPFLLKIGELINPVLGGEHEETGTKNHSS